MQPTTFVSHPAAVLQQLCTRRSLCRARRPSSSVTSTSRNIILAAHSSRQDINANISARIVIESDNDRENDEDENDEGPFIVNIEDEDYDEKEFDVNNSPFNSTEATQQDYGVRRPASTADLEFAERSRTLVIGDDDGDDDLMMDGVTVVDVTPVQRTKKVRAKTSALINAISTQPEPDTEFAADAESFPELEDDETLQLVRTSVMAADMRKGEDIVALRVSKLTHITSFVVMITGNNAPQLRAIANLVEDDLSKQHSLEPRRIDGVPNSGWLLLDCTFPI